MGRSGWVTGDGRIRELDGLDGLDGLDETL